MGGNWVPQAHSIHKVYAASGWNSRTYSHDLAIVIMKTPFIFNAKIASIKLDVRPEYNILKDESCCKVAGWGEMENGTYPTKLREVGVPIFDFNTCANNYAKSCREGIFEDCVTVPTDTFCAGGGEDGKDSCFADSGGPILCNYDEGNYLTGIVSFGPPNECGFSTVPGVYTKISSFESNIEQVLMDSPNFNSSEEYDGLKVLKLWKNNEIF